MTFQQPSAPDALLSLEAGEVAAALGLAREAVRHDGAQPLAWMVLGRAAQALGDFEEAAGAYARLDRLRPNRAAILLAQAQCLAEADRLLEGSRCCAVPSVSAAVPPRTPISARCWRGWIALRKRAGTCARH